MPDPGVGITGKRMQAAQHDAGLGDQWFEALHLRNVQGLLGESGRFGQIAPMQRFGRTRQQGANLFGAHAQRCSSRQRFLRQRATMLETMLEHGPPRLAHQSTHFIDAWAGRRDRVSEQPCARAARYITGEAIPETAHRDQQAGRIRAVPAGTPRFHHRAGQHRLRHGPSVPDRLHQLAVRHDAWTLPHEEGQQIEDAPSHALAYTQPAQLARIEPQLAVPEEQTLVSRFVLIHDRFGNGGINFRFSEVRF